MKFRFQDFPLGLVCGFCKNLIQHGDPIHPVRAEAVPGQHFSTPLYLFSCKSCTVTLPETKQESLERIRQELAARPHTPRKKKS